MRCHNRTIRRSLQLLCISAAVLAGCGQKGITKAEAAKDLQAGKFISGANDKKRFALTFDDGPKPEATPPLLAELKRLGVHATFFLVGKQAQRYPDLVRAIYADGHQIANHSFNHLNLKELTLDAAMKELTDCQSLLQKQIGKEVIYWRPPGGNYSSELVQAAKKQGMVMVLWTINTADYANKSQSEIEQAILQKASPGGIALLHTGVPATIAALPKIVGTLREKGYEFVTVDALAKGIQ